MTVEWEDPNIAGLDRYNVYFSSAFEEEAEKRTVDASQHRYIN